MRPRLIAISLAAFLALTACTTSAEGGTERVDVPAPVERAADVTLVMRSGSLHLAGGAAGLLEGTLAHAGDEKPAVTTGSRETTAGKVVTVAVEQPPLSSAVATPPLWDLLVNGGLPTDIEVSNASGELDLDLGLADPKLLRITSKSGNVRLALAGPHPSLSALALEAASGNVDIAATGEYPALESFEATAASGRLSADLSGPWHKDATLRLSAATGDVTVVLPRGVNVQVNVVGGGKVSAEGLAPGVLHSVPYPSRGIAPRHPMPTGWVRASDAASPYTLTVVVRADRGRVTLRVAPKK